MTETTAERTRAIVEAAEDLAETWQKTFPAENSEIFYNLSCSEIQPLIDLLRAVGADTTAYWVEYTHAECDYEETDIHHAIYLKRKQLGEI